MSREAAANSPRGEESGFRDVTTLKVERKGSGERGRRGDRRGERSIGKIGQTNKRIGDGEKGRTDQRKISKKVRKHYLRPGSSRPF